MIQRIQTLFLLLAILVLGVFLWMPLISLQATNYTEPIPGWDIRHFFNGYIYFVNLILTGVAAGFAFIAIFQFKHRSMQRLFCWFSIIFIGFAEALVFYKYQTKVFIGDVVFTWWNALALLAALLVLLAIIYIRKDENLLSSADRLR